MWDLTIKDFSAGTGSTAVTDVDYRIKGDLTVSGTSLAGTGGGVYAKNWYRALGVPAGTPNADTAWEGTHTFNGTGPNCGN